MSILVRHAMTESPQTITPEMNAFDAAGMMKSEDVGVLPVVKDGRLVGLVTDRDLVLRVLAERLDVSAHYLETGELIPAVVEREIEGLLKGLCDHAFSIVHNSGNSCSFAMAVVFATFISATSYV